MYRKGSPYRDAEESSHLRLCLHNSMINSAPRIGETSKNGIVLYGQCLPRRVKDTQITDSENANVYHL